MATKYYQASRANNVIRYNDSSFRFEVTEMVSGSWWGVYESSDSSEQAVLDEMAEANVVVSLTKDQYEASKKKAQSNNNSISSQQESQLAQAEDVEPVVKEDKQESLDELLKVENVQAPKRKKAAKKKSV